MTPEDPLRSWVEARLGLVLDESRRSSVLEALGGPPGAGDDDPGALCRRWDRGVEHPTRWAAAVRALTNHESSFYRERGLYDLLEAELRRVGPRPGRPYVILSAGCSLGQELYSCALVARKVLGERWGPLVTLLGVDVDGAALERARLGIYRPWEVRGLDADVLERHFRPLPDGTVQLEAGLRAAARFETLNLVDAWPADWSERFDLVLFRNVLLYLSARARADVLARVPGILVPGGVLAVASAEVAAVPPEELLGRDEHEGYFHFRRAAAGRGQDAPPDTASTSWRPARPGAEGGVGATVGGRRALDERPVELGVRTADGGAVGVRDPWASRGPAGVVRECFELLRRGDLPGVTAACSAARSGLAGRLSCEEEGALWAMEGVAEAARGRHAQALRALERAACLAPLSWVSHFHRGEALWEGGDRAGAEASFRRAQACLSRPPQMAVDELFLGGFDARRMGEVCRFRIEQCRMRGR